MKLNHIIIIIIIININYINCQTICPESPNYNFEDSHCDSDFKYILKPTIYLYNFYQYTNITCEPQPVKEYIRHDVYQIVLDNNQLYKCKLKNENCNQNQEINVTTSLGPKLLITQPKCINSYAIIDYSTGDDSSSSNNEYSINNKIVQLPYEILLNDLSNITDQNIFILKRDGDWICKTNFYLNQGTIQNHPEFSITHSTCNSNSGKIKILNHQQYSKITLYNSNSTQLKEQVYGSGSGINGIFENLTSDNYTIILESSQCGKQNFKIQIDNISPNYKLNIVNDECPLKPTYKLEFEGSTKYLYNISTSDDGSVNIGNPFTVNGDNNIILNIMSCGKFTIPISKVYSVPPIHYTISNTDDFCSGNYSVKLLYNSTLISNLKGSIINNNNNNNSSTTTTTPLIISNNSFNIVYNNQNLIYQLSSDCYSESINIIAPSRKPYYEISTPKTKYCNELVDIKVLNYLDFTTLRLHSTNGIYYQHSKGIFKNVPNQQYQLQFIYRTCSNEIDSIKIGIKREANIYFKSNIISSPSCNTNKIQLPGLVEFTIYDNFTNNIIMVTDPKEYYYNFNNTTPYSINLNGYSNCIANFNFNYNYDKLKYKINIIKYPTCKYSNDGLFQIVSNDSAINWVSINGVSKNGPNYGINSGLNKIEISVYSPCIGDVVFMNVDPKYSNFNLLYDITPIESCDSSNASISIKDYEKYSSLKLDNQDLINGSSGNTKDSGYHTLDFTIQLDNETTCVGTKQIYIPTRIETDIKYRIISQPICYHSLGSISIDSIAYKNDNKSINIDSINGKEGSTYVTDLNFNNYSSDGTIITIKSGSCSWNKKIDIKLNQFNVSAELDSYYIQDCVGYTRYKIKSNYIYSTLRIDEDGSYFDYYTVNSIDGDQIIEIDDGLNFCISPIKLLAIQPLIPTIKYNIQFNYNGDDCVSSFSTINIQVEDYLNYKYLMYDGISIDSNGYFLNVKQGGVLVGELLNLNCKLIENINNNHQFMVINNISKSITNETCYQSLNGEIQINNQDNQLNENYYLIQNYQSDSYYSLKSLNSISTFQLLGSQDIKIIKINKLHPSCIQYQFYNMNTIEPQVNYNNEICSNDNLIYTLNKNNLFGQYLINSINNNNNNSSSGVGSSGGNALLNGNNNYTIQFKINSDYCKRILEDSVSISVNECNNNLGLKIGLPIGLFFFLLFATIAGVVIYNKRSQFIKSKTVEPINHDYNSVKIFTGNTIKEIDKF